MSFDKLEKSIEIEPGERFGITRGTIIEGYRIAKGEAKEETEGFVDFWKVSEFGGESGGSIGL